MIRRIIESSMQFRFLVAALSVALMVFGFTQLGKSRVDALPEFSAPYVELQTEALGLSAQEVEAMITTPLEADMLNGTPWVEEIRSQSIPGLSSIVLTFKKGTDIMRARQMVQEKLIEVFALPNVSKPTTMLNPLSSTSRCMEIGLTSDEMSLIEMSVLARWTIVPRLMGLPGVANVSIWGQRKRQLQVQVDPEKLRDEGVTLMQVIKTTGNALWASPLTFLEASSPGTGGWIDTPNQRLGVRHILPITTAADLARVTVEAAPSLRLADIATVVEDHQPLIGDAIVNDNPSLMLVVEKFPWANTLDVTREVEKAVTALRPGLSGLEMDVSLFRRANFIELAIDNLSLGLLIGFVLVVLAMFAFLSNWRTALVGTASILLSAIAAGAVLYLSGTTINMMIIAGLLMALCVVIDNAIIDPENIGRHLRKHQREGGEKPIERAIRDASFEMRSPIVYATLIIILVVLPVFALEGITGAFFKPLVMSYVLALFASMLVAVTVTPALSLLFLKRASFKAELSRITRILFGIYNGLFAWAVRKPRPAVAAVGACALVGIFTLPMIRQKPLLPEFMETDLVINWMGNSGASHQAMSRITRRASRELRALPGVRNVSAHVGRALMSDRRTNINAGEIWVSIDSDADYDATLAAVKEIVEGYPGLSHEGLTYLQTKIREELTGATNEELVVRVYGEDLGIIRSKAEEVKQILDGMDGISDAEVEDILEEPTLEIEVDLDKAKHYGLKPGDIRRATTSIVSGIEVGNLFEEQKVFDVLVWGVPESRHSLTSIQNLLISTPSGGHVLLKEVADLRIVPTVTVINRESVARYVDVTADVSRGDIASIATQVEHRLQEVDFPLEYRAELVGKYAERLSAQRRILAFAVAAAVGVLLLLQAFFKSWRLAMVVFVALPMALLGGVLATMMMNGKLVSLASIVGLFAVFAIAVRNSILLVSCYRHLERESGISGSEMVLQGTRERSVPILMTAATIGLALLPLAFSGRVAGLEIAHPMAIIILGGLVTSTIFTLVGIPALYVLFGAAREPDLELLPPVKVE